MWHASVSPPGTRRIPGLSRNERRSLEAYATFVLKSVGVRGPRRVAHREWGSKAFHLRVFCTPEEARAAGGVQDVRNDPVYIPVWQR